MKYPFKVVEVTQNVANFLCANKAKVLLPDWETSYDFLQRITPGEVIEVDCKKVLDLRSYRQLKFVRQAFRYFAHHSDNPETQYPDQVEELVKLAVGYVSGVYHYRDKEGNERINFETGSLSFEKLGHIKGTNIIDQMVCWMAANMGMDKDSFTQAVRESVGQISFSH